MDTAITPSPHVLVESAGPVRRLVLNRPSARNLLTTDMIEALSDALDAPGAQVIVIASQGPAFCAGHDMKAMAAHHADEDGGKAYFQALFSACGAMMEKIAALPTPVIAEVHAPAVAAGCQLVAACDLAIAADTATFGTTGVTFGLYCSTPAVPLTRTVAPKHAAEMLMTGSLIDAQHAERIGLINRAVPAERLTQEVMALAERIASHSAAVVALGKRATTQTRQLPLGEAYARASQAMVENLLLPDGREGLAAFRDKRPAAWQHTTPDKQEFWDARYTAHAAPFGREPNAFLVSVRDKLPAGKAFTAADGQGRNALWLAREGFDVTLNDLSPVAVENARANAAAAGLPVKAAAADLCRVPPPHNTFQVVTAIYLHVPPQMRVTIHEALAAALAPGGVLVLEAFSKQQIGNPSGGPKNPDLLYDTATLRGDFPGLEPIHLEECEVDLSEGEFHRGRAAVVRAMLRKPS
ncbi:MAG: enoyl-CoA hydratase-related protein [Pseudomonadota bacterium]